MVPFQPLGTTQDKVAHLLALNSFRLCHGAHAGFWIGTMDWVIVASSPVSDWLYHRLDRDQYGSQITPPCCAERLGIQISQATLFVF